MTKNTHCVQNVQVLTVETGGTCYIRNVQNWTLIATVATSVWS